MIEAKVNSLRFLNQVNIDMKKFDSQPPVFYLVIRQWSEDPKHLIPGTGPTKIQG